MPAPCGAMVEVDGVRHLCSIAPPVGRDLAAGHQHKPHRCEPDGYEWPACSQMCAQNHVHGRYRIKMGAAVGPTTLPARAPKASSAKPKVRRCEACLGEAELGRNGRCVDREACEARAPTLL